MNTSGGGGAEGWMIAVPILGLLVAASMSAGGVDAMLSALDGVIRTAAAAVVDLVGRLF